MGESPKVGRTTSERARPPRRQAARRRARCDAASGLIGPPRESRCARAAQCAARRVCRLSAARTVGSPIRLLAGRSSLPVARTQRRSPSAPRPNRSARRRQRVLTDQAGSTPTIAYRTPASTGRDSWASRAPRSRYTGRVPLTRYAHVQGERCAHTRMLGRPASSRSTLPTDCPLLYLSRVRARACGGGSAHAQARRVLVEPSPKARGTHSVVDTLCAFYD
jgi:hypothetical protein